MCDDNVLEGCFKDLLVKEIQSIEDSCNDDVTAVTFPPFSAKMRFLLHSTLQDHPAFQTVSVGIEPNRKPVIFKPRSRIKIVDVPEGEEEKFDSRESEFEYRTGIRNCKMREPNRDFTIFTRTNNSLPDNFASEYPFVLLSRGIGYGIIRRTLRSYYRQGAVNCYEVREEDRTVNHILCLTDAQTADEIFSQFEGELKLYREPPNSVTSNVLAVMVKCERLKAAVARTVLVDRSAAAKIMSRHLAPGAGGDRVSNVRR